MLAGKGVDVVLDLEGPLPEGFGPFAQVECMSVLEHSKRPWLLAENLQRALQPDGTLYLTVPFIWRVHGYPDDYWRFTASGVRLMFPEIEWEHEAYSHISLTDADHISVIPHDGFAYFARTELLMFGRKNGLSDLYRA